MDRASFQMSNIIFQYSHHPWLFIVVIDEQEPVRNARKIYVCWLFHNSDNGVVNSNLISLLSIFHRSDS